MAGDRDTSDSDLVERARSGEPEAFQQLAERHSATVFRCAVSLGQDRQLAEDLTQETWLEAWRSIARFDGRCRFSTWLYGILRHRYLKALRRDDRRPLPSQALSDADVAPPARSDPVQPTERAEAAERIREAVSRLPDEHRPVIELRFFAGASLDEIAALLGIPLGTVKSRLHNGLEKLRQQELLVNLVAVSRETRVRQP